MSTTATETTPNQAPAPDQTNQPDPVAVALDALNRNVYVPVFCQKMAADHDIHVRSEEELLKYLQLDAFLKAQETNGTAKQAQARSSFIDEALDFAARSVGAEAPNAVLDAQVKEAAAQWSSEPAIRDAALLLADAIRRSA